MRMTTLRAGRRPRRASSSNDLAARITGALRSRPASTLHTCSFVTPARSATAIWVTPLFRNWSLRRARVA